MDDEEISHLYELDFSDAIKIIADVLQLLDAGFNLDRL